ncbi:VOC family protein [Metabacillus halosaccharovorans]|uniref:VOC family protein n=1 Tax=Metabacillus halosaccharovorans TaxID=930124 RepID=UPI002041BD24|nr:VOC family protein [Metabacillus halosaccharovorans]MCM3439369.1 VOC family protein [Metabacillus halosaccharovorans]
MNKILKITTNLWFNTEAEEAAKHYVSIFNNSKIERMTYYQNVQKVMTVEFQLEEQKFVALNGGPQYKFTEAISFIVHCDSQDELDYYWDKLSEGGDKKAQVCGWLKDQFGVSWQIVPTNLTEMINDEDPEKVGRAMKALLSMDGKIDMNALERVYLNLL